MYRKQEYKQGNENEIIHRAHNSDCVVYCCEAWTLKKAEEKQLLVFETAALRKILGIHIMDKKRNENNGPLSDGHDCAKNA